MENEILENGAAPETEEVQEAVAVTETAEAPETVEVEQTEQTEQTEQPAAAKAGNKFTDALAKAADKGKALVADPKPLLDKIKAIPKKIWIAAGAAVAAVVALILILSIVTNTYKTPIKLMQAAENNKKASTYYDKNAKTLNGFCEDEYKEILKIMKKADDYEDALDYLEETIEENKENYGNNYKYKYKVVDKEKIDKDDLRDVQKSIRSQGKAMVNELEDMDSDDYEDMADELGLTKSQAKKVAKAGESIGKILKKAKVTKGYELTVEITLTGSEVEDEEPIERTISVYKVDGRWISSSALTMLFYAI